MLLSTYVGVSEFVNRLRRNTSGVTAIEYGLIAGAIAVVIIGAVQLLGGGVRDAFNAVAAAIAPPAAN
jgi:pilus assembly protein Flp/PilA